MHDPPHGNRANLMHAGSIHLRQRKIDKTMACQRCLLEAYDILQPAANVTKKRSETARYTAFLSTWNGGGGDATLTGLQ
jgi:hypothetical protein